MNRKKILIPIICMSIMMFSFLVAKIPPSHADSGFDSSYDSGSSSSSDSSSSFDHSSSGSSSSSPSKPMTLEEVLILLGICIVPVSLVFIIPAISRKKENKRKKIFEEVENKMSYDEFHKYCKYKIEEIDKARLQNKLETIKDLLTEKLYQTYQNELTEIKEKDYELLIAFHKYMKITSISRKNNGEETILDIIATIYKTECIAKKNSNKIIKGSDSLGRFKYKITYKISSSGKKWIIGDYYE